MQPKIYVQGSTKDTTSGSNDNTIYAITAGVIGVLAIAVGVSLTVAKSPPGMHFLPLAFCFPGGFTMTLRLSESSLS
jgi:hypothetical protein